MAKWLSGSMAKRENKVFTNFDAFTPLSPCAFVPLVIINSRTNL
jgi:hypothetical protein